MKKLKCYWGRRLCVILLFILLIYTIPIQSVAEHREYDVEKFQATISISPSSLKTVDLNFENGEELEFIYSLQVKHELPIDVWFVNDENYNKFIEGGEFLYYIEGSQEYVIIATNIVGVKELNKYKLILANYNNQTVEVDIIYEIRIYKDYSTEDSSDDPLTSNLLFILLVAMVILSAFLILHFIKNRRLQYISPEITEKASSKKSKRHSKPKHKTKSNISDKAASKKPKSHKSSKNTKQSKHKAKKRDPPESDFGFCGHCGKPVDTPYCMYCGGEVKN